MSRTQNTLERILVAMLDAEPLLSRTIAEKVGVVQNTVRDYLPELRRHGLIVGARKPHAVYWLTEAGVKAARTWLAESSKPGRTFGETWAQVTRPAIPTEQRQWWQV